MLTLDVSMRDVAAESTPLEYRVSIDRDLENLIFRWYRCETLESEGTVAPCDWKELIQVVSDCKPPSWLSDLA